LVLEAADLLFKGVVERPQLPDAGFGGFEIVDADVAGHGRSRLRAERPALDHVLPAEIMLGDEGACRQRCRCAFAIMVRAEQAENALEALDVSLLNLSVSVTCDAL